MKLVGFRVVFLGAVSLAACTCCQGDHTPSSPASSAGAQALGVESAAVCSVVGPPPKSPTATSVESSVFPKLGPGLGNRMKEAGKQPPPPDPASPRPPASVGQKQREFLGAVAAAEPSWSKLSPSDKDAARAALKEQMLIGGSL